MDYRKQASTKKLTKVLFAALLVNVLALAQLACSRAKVELSETAETPMDVAQLYARYFPSFLTANEEVKAESFPKVSAETMKTDLREEADACRARIEDALESPALPGAPRLEANRALVLARSKAEPVVFMETPHFVGEVSPGTKERRQALETTQFPSEVLRQTISTFNDNPKRLRDLLLRDGYLYTDDPRSANLLTTDVTLEKLFTEEAIVMQRGSERLSVRKSKEGGYYFSSGSQAQKRARLLLFDRLWVEGEEPGPPLHVDFRELTEREGIEGVRISHLGEQDVVAEVRFGEEWVPALIERDGVNLSLGCLLIEEEDVGRVGRERDEAYRRTLVLDALRRAIADQVELGLPFDEPRTERGQQDGKLRERFERAYHSKRESYEFNGDTYPVYNARGDALAPQVCIDFVTETFERASGMHLTPKDQTPTKVLGALDFDELLEGSRRQEMAIRNYARTNPHRFSLIDYPLSEWVRYEKIDQFFEFLSEQRDEIRPGDIVIIRGRAAWDHYREIHTHTFIIYQSDPITGMPTLLAGNAGKPRISTWDGEMLRAPKRSIRHRIRPNMEWLYDHLVLRTPLRGEQWAAPISLSEL